MTVKADEPKVDADDKAPLGNIQKAAEQPKDNGIPTKSADELIVDKLIAKMHNPLDAVPTLRAIFYGDIGSGKTTAACDAPDVLLIAVEKGQSSLVNHPEVLEKVKKVLEYTSVKQVENLAEQFKKGAFPQFKTIVIDTFSELQEDSLDNRIREQAKIDFNHDEFRPEGGDYQANTTHMRRIAAAFKDVPANVIFVCHDKDEKNDITGVINKKPSPTAKVTKTINQYADLVVYFKNEVDEKTDEETFWAYLRPCRLPEGRITAKTRIKSLPNKMQDFTFQKALDAKLNQINELKKENDK